jgi:hypothetical protein
MVIDLCSPADDSVANHADGSGQMQIRLSFVVDSLEEEDRCVSLLAFAGVREIDSVVLNPADPAG